MTDGTKKWCEENIRTFKDVYNLVIYLVTFALYCNRVDKLRKFDMRKADR